MTIKEDLTKFKRESRIEFDKLQRSMKSMRASFNKRMKTLEEHLETQATVQEAKKDGTVSISPEAWRLILILAAIIAAGAGLGNIL